MSIQRHRFYRDSMVGDCNCDVEKDADGCYVEYEDHITTVAELKAKIAELEATSHCKYCGDELATYCNGCDNDE